MQLSREALLSRIAAGWEAQQRGVRGRAGCLAPAFRGKQGDSGEGLNSAALRRHGAAVGDRGQPGGAAERGARCAGGVGGKQRDKLIYLVLICMITKVPLIR